MVVVYYCSVEHILWQQLKKYLTIVSAEEAEHILSLRLDQDKSLTLAGKILLLQALKEYCLWKKERLPKLLYTFYKRPFIAEFPIDFNISHSGNMVACAFSLTGRTGIDVEIMKPVDLDDYKEVFSDVEFSQIITAINPLETFYSYWTLKEAVIKADGRGFFLNPLQVEVNNDESVVYDKRWFISYLNLDTSYACCVSCDTIEKPMLKEIFLNEIVI